MISEGIGFGKAILFNEHFVVYGIPSIVSAIGKYTIAKISPSEATGFKISDERGATPGYKDGKIDQQKVSFQNIINKMNLNFSKEGINVELGGNLYASSGIGASAASCVAIARALNNYYNSEPRYCNIG